MSLARLIAAHPVLAATPSQAIPAEFLGGMPGGDTGVGLGVLASALAEPSLHLLGILRGRPSSSAPYSSRLPRPSAHRSASAGALRIRAELRRFVRCRTGYSADPTPKIHPSNSETVVAVSSAMTPASDTSAWSSSGSE